MNILIYVIDALRADHLSCLGYNRATCPNMDEFAKESITYSNCFSPATWTRSAAASLLSGTYPSTHGVRTHSDQFTANIERLSQRLSKSGFTTIGINSNGNISSPIGFNHGFDEYRDIYTKDKIRRSRLAKKTQDELDFGTGNEIALPKAEDINNEIFDIVDSTTDDHFLFCWAIDPHTPYRPEEEFDIFTSGEYDGPVDGTEETLDQITSVDDIQHLIDLYDGEIRYADHYFGELVESLKREGVYDDTLLVLVGDHGEAFNEHGDFVHGNPPYEEMIHVPLFIKPPGQDDSLDTTVDDLVSLVDIYPTILDILELDHPTTLQGQSIYPFNTDRKRQKVFAETQERSFEPEYLAIRTDEWKYMRINDTTDSETVTDGLKYMRENNLLVKVLKNPFKYLREYVFSDESDRMLYDLKSDPEENENLIDEYREISENLERELNEWRQKCVKANETISHEESGEIDERTTENLRQLGYLD